MDILHHVEIENWEKQRSIYSILEEHHNVDGTIFSVTTHLGDLCHGPMLVEVYQ